MEMVPEDIASLKRPALQKLCKKFGIKANGKNIDMIRALEELKNSSMQGCVESFVPSESSKTDADGDNPHEEQPPSLQANEDETPPKASNKKQGGRRKRKTQKRSSKTKRNKLSVESTASEQSPILTKDVLTMKENGLSTQMSIEGTVLELSRETGAKVDRDKSETKKVVAGRKRKRRDTYSLSPNSSMILNSPMVVNKHPRLEEGGENLTRLSAVSTPLCDDSEQNSSSSPDFPSASDKENLNTSEMDMETNSDVQPPFSPPISGEDMQQESLPSQHKRKRNSTFVVSSERSTPLLPTVDGDNETASTSHEDQPSEPQTKRLRRETFSVSPKVSPGGGVSEKSGLELKEVTLSGDGDDMKQAILDMLDKRVEERQADPNYKPVFTGGTDGSSRIPVKSSTAHKFDKAHKKQFSKMKNIATAQKEKEKRARSLTSKFCAKRAKSMVGNEKPPSIQNKPKPSNIPKAVTKKAGTTSTSTSAFKPSVLSTKHATFNFSSKPPSNKTPHKNGAEKVYSKTPAKSLATTASTKKTPGKAPFDINASLKRKPAYKPYTGKLPVYHSHKPGQ